MDMHTAQHMNAMKIGANHLAQHKNAIDRDTAIRLANARKNAEAIGRQRRYNQAMADKQADRNLKERMHMATLALKKMELEARGLLG
tara:strand:- start:325 stop:585 length:261 start_codon:yes stop_codon:yes gene_type:complete